MPISSTSPHETKRLKRQCSPSRPRNVKSKPAPSSRPKPVGFLPVEPVRLIWASAYSLVEPARWLRKSRICSFSSTPCEGGGQEGYGRGVSSHDRKAAWLAGEIPGERRRSRTCSSFV